jgi:nucleotide-binding universal stress UspA family protein
LTGDAFWTAAMFSKIVIPLDGSPVAEAALPYARALARGGSLPVELLSVIDLDEMARHIAAERGLFLDTLDDFETHRRNDYLSALAKSFTGVQVTWRVERGEAASTIVESAAADKAALVCMATHGRSGLQRWLLGSVAEKVLRASENPLLLVRASGSTPVTGVKTLDAIIVPLDGSSVAEQVLPAVAEAAKSLDIELILFRAYNIPYGSFYEGGGSYAVDLQRLSTSIETDVQLYLEDRRDVLGKAGLAKVAYASKEGLAADAIIDFARNKPGGLIVMCSHGRSGVRRWALGSVTETVVRHAVNPVLILRAAA